MHWLQTIMHEIIGFAHAGEIMIKHCYFFIVNDVE